MNREHLDNVDRDHNLARNHNLDRHIEKWYILKQEISELERKLNHHKNKIKTYIESNNIDSIVNSSNTIIVDSRCTNTSRISRTSVPPAIWNEYAKKSSYNVYNIRKVGRSPARSPKHSR